MCIPKRPFTISIRAVSALVSILQAVASSRFQGTNKKATGNNAKSQFKERNAWSKKDSRVACAIASSNVATTAKWRRMTMELVDIRQSFWSPATPTNVLLIWKFLPKAAAHPLQIRRRWAGGDLCDNIQHLVFRAVRVKFWLNCSQNDRNES